MNKIYLTKRGHDGKTVVCSELTRRHGKVKSLVLAVASATAALAAPSALAAGGSITVDNSAGIAAADGRELYIVTNKGYSVETPNGSIYDLVTDVELSYTYTGGTSPQRLLSRRYWMLTIPIP